MSGFDERDDALLLSGARLVLTDRVTCEADILVKGAFIQSVAEKHTLEQSTIPAIDLTGLIVYPGFIDIHIHGAKGVDTMSATDEDLYRVSQFLASQGVTAWIPTLVPGSDEDNKRAVAAIDALMANQEQKPAAARAIGVHYEGPFVNNEQCGALRKEFFRTYSGGSDLKRLPTPTAHNAVRMMTIAPEIEGGLDLVRNLSQCGWVVSIGHTKASVDVLERAHEAGARHVTHFMNAMPSLHHRAPGPVGWGLTCDDVTVDLIADGIHVDPLVLNLILRSKTAQRVALISDSVAPTGLGDGSYRLWDETITVTKGRTRNERGSIAGSVISLHDAFRLVRSLGVSDVDLASLVSTNAAQLLGIDGSYGSIAEGKRADLVGIDDSGQVKLTIIGGRIAFDGRE